MRGLAIAAIAAIAASLAACGKGAAQGAPLPSASAPETLAATAIATSGDEAGAPMDARETAQWTAAKEGEPEELGRLARLVGCEGLRERGESPDLRGTAARAMQFCTDFTELPWLAGVAASGPDDDARAALESIVELAAQRRRATDPEDADELHTGCGALLDLARAKDRPKERRVLAIRALRMLADRGCVQRAEVPTELDAK